MYDFIAILLITHKRLSKGATEPSCHCLDKAGAVDPTNAEAQIPVSQYVDLPFSMRNAHWVYITKREVQVISDEVYLRILYKGFFTRM